MVERKIHSASNIAPAEPSGSEANIRLMRNGAQTGFSLKNSFQEMHSYFGRASLGRGKRVPLELFFPIP